MQPDSNQPEIPPDDKAEHPAEPDGSKYIFVFVIYAGLILFFHPACAEEAFGLRRMPSSYRNIYCIAMTALVVRGLISSEKILFWLGVVAALMLATVLVLPTLR